MFKTLGPSRNRVLRAVARLLASAASCFGWLSVRYPTLSLQARLEQFNALSIALPPGTTIRFNDHFVPYITAQSDPQAAFALGVVTEFQRGPQLQFLKRLAQGRLSEMGGSGFVDMDHLIRLLDFAKSAPAMWEAMPADSREWVEQFVNGLNAVQSKRPRGVDEKLLGIQPEPYTPLDVLLLGRLAGADVNWSIYFSLIEQRHNHDFVHWWRKLRQVGAGVLTSFDLPESTTQPTVAQRLADFLSELGRSGSNAFALSAHKTTTGFPLLMNDPHLGQHLPNVWMLVGLHSPSYQCVGLMFPGVPVLGLGRNLDVAWGGTNLRAAASDCVRLTEQDEADCIDVQTRIRVRFSWSRRRRLRHSRHGPVLTDCQALGRLFGRETLALRWAGHWVTDEITSFLQTMRAHTVSQVHAAMAGVGVTPLNVLAADRHGNIGHVLAATLPHRDGFPEDDWILSSDSAAASWAQRRCANDFPKVINPVAGYLVSANNRPADAPGLGFLFNGDDRVARARQLLDAKGRFTTPELLAIQRDVTSPKAAALAGQMAEFCLPHIHNTDQRVLCNALLNWNGQYSADSMAALQMEFLLTALVRLLARLRLKGRVPSLMHEWTYLTDGLMDDLESLTTAERTQHVPACVDEACRMAQRWQMWGNLHKIRPRHVLGYLPILGKLFSARSFPASGSRETLMKNAHGLITGFDETSYGSQSRHWSCLSHPDANHFVLLGGQDGWVGSQLLVDQIPLWQAAQTIQMPLLPQTVHALFTHCVGTLE
ncbi:MAG TPA: penicillin acylase family protein [Limnobacter sp.]|uniref:penicillin acylase family protein n=1 Tax=Limnobacter sp. TaxID=2003368 RepID=UPI002ED922A8